MERGAPVDDQDLALDLGRERAREFLEQNPTILQEVKTDVLRACGEIPSAPTETTEPPAADATQKSGDGAASASKAALERGMPKKTGK